MIQSIHQSVRSVIICTDSLSVVFLWDTYIYIIYIYIYIIYIYIYIIYIYIYIYIYMKEDYH